MANFFIIDHSLRKSGGHHFDYVSCVAEAANELGYLTTIGTNRTFKKNSGDDPDSIERKGNVRRIFRDHTYQSDSYLAGLQHLTRSNSSDSLLDEFEPSRFKRFWNLRKKRKHQRRRETFVRHFASDCEKFFRSSLQTDNDHAFFTTVSELELMGLAAYLASKPDTLNTTWHLQFHFNLFEGRTPEYGSQDFIAKAVRACFMAAMARLSYHSINFYATSETLVDQYNRLGVGEFELLPHPVSPEFALDNRFANSKSSVKIGQSFVRSLVSDAGQDSYPTQIEDSATTLRFPHAEDGAGDFDLSERGNAMNSEEFRKPLRFTCPGELRREKNQVEYLQPLVNDIWQTHLSTGNAQIVLQRPAKRWHAKQEKIELELPDSGVELPTPPVEYFSHPLGKQDYIDLIKSSDCGLLFYDSRVYFSRRAGVLGELLSAGKPVIVPAGSWLGDQIEEPIFRHVDGLIESSRLVRTIDSTDFQWNSRNVPMAGGVLSFDEGRHPFDFTVQRESSGDGQSELSEHAMVLQFDWHWPNAHGIYCRINVTQNDENGNVVETSNRVVGFRYFRNKVNALFALKPETKTVKFSLSNAFHDSTASIKRVKIQTLAHSNEAERENGFPLGSVGVIASDVSDLANCMDEMIRHFDHYRTTAMQMAPHWYADHDPRRTVEHLVTERFAQRRAA